MLYYSRKLAYKCKMSRSRSPSFIHHKHTKTDKPIFENGITIVRDYRCRESPRFFWALRVELIPTKDKLLIQFDIM